MLLTSLSRPVAICAVMWAAVGCQSDRRLPRFYAGPLSSDDVIGTWVMDGESAARLSEIGYEIFTNRLDHVVRLSEDGSCVYRSFDSYGLPQFRRRRPERILHSGFFGEGGRLWPQGTARSWYVWSPDSPEIIAGPYFETNGLSGAVGIVQKNRWTRWELSKSRSLWGGFDYDSEIYDGGRCRYRLRLFRGEFSSPIYLWVGKDDSGLFLWQPIRDSYDSFNFWGDIVRFRKYARE